MFATIRGAGVMRRSVLLLGVSIASAVVALVATGSLAAIAAPAASAPQTRVASCPGLDFAPLDSATGSAYAASKRYRTGSDGSGFFVCNSSLPNGAVVTKVQFSLWDGQGVTGVKYCGLYRSGLASVDTSESIQELAAVPYTGTNTAPGFIRETDSTIHYATVNNKAFAYWLQCNLELDGQSLGIYGADVVYTITAANG
jgi:hypothetical protein